MDTSRRHPDFVVPAAVFCSHYTRNYISDDLSTYLLQKANAWHGSCGNPDVIRISWPKSRAGDVLGGALAHYCKASIHAWW